MSRSRNRLTLIKGSLASLSGGLKSARAGRAYDTRFWEIDAVRGVAIGMMIIYHLMFDLYFFRISDAIFTYRFWFYFQRTTASTFLFLVGVSLAVYRIQCLQRGQNVRYAALLLRGLRIFAWGLVVSVVTWFALGSPLYIRFGVLHFIGVSIALAYPFLAWRWQNLLLGVLLLILGAWLSDRTFTWTWLFWLGFEPRNHQYVDFFPLIPWFGVVLFGIAAGNFFYRPEGRLRSLPDLSALVPVQALQWLGRHSLPIYLLHQPVLIALLLALVWGLTAF